MASGQSKSSNTVVAESGASPSWLRQNWSLLLAIIVLVAGVMAPTPEGLSVAGQRMLAILAFAVIVWMTEVLDYAVSALVIAALMALLLGYAPNVAKPEVLLGTSGGLRQAFAGFSNTAWVLVTVALFLAAAMQVTRLDRRIALYILSKAGTDVRHVVIGSIVVGIVMAFLIPSTTARVACIVPITLGIITVFGVDRKGALAGMLMITTVSTASIWNIGIKTSAAQNLVAVGFIERELGHVITWSEWFIAAAPFAIVMSVLLYYVMMWMMTPEVKEVPGGREAIARSLAELGPMSGAEVRLLTLSLILLVMWATEGVLHSIDTSTSTTVAVALMFMPGIGVMGWKEAQAKIPWGTVLLFGVGISLGSALLASGAATYLANLVVSVFGLASTTPFMVLMILAVFLIVVHLGFASATALASAMIPIVIAVFKALGNDQINIVGLTMLLQFVVSFGFILVVNAPQNMVAYGTGTFEAKTFTRVGLVLTAIACILFVLMSLTYWKWLGYV